MNNINEEKRSRITSILRKTKIYLRVLENGCHCLHHREEAVDESLTT